MNTPGISIIGAGFAGLSAASVLAQKGYQVTVFEKNDQPGGRARTWEKDGFHFDMGPSWYWMPDVFESYYNLFGHTASYFYHLKRLNPSYRIYWEPGDYSDIPSEMAALKKLFEQIDPGSGSKLDQFLRQAEHKYLTGMGDFVFRPSHSIKEYADLRILKAGLRLQLFSSMNSHIRKYFRHSKIIRLLEFPVLFLGGTARTIPALYSLMNYADLVLGTWYPMGGMNRIVKAMVSIAEQQGVKIVLNAGVNKINVKNKKAVSIETAAGIFDTDLVISNADYVHTEQAMLPEQHRNYSAAYWNKRTMSPSSLIFYIGLNKKLKNIQHHNLFFDKDFRQHAKDIYTTPRWPEEPLFYVCCPSVTDPDVAPPGCENLFFLMPVAAGLYDTEELRRNYFDLLISRFETVAGESIRDSVIVSRSYAVNDFISDYNSFKGNAYGLANTLRQTAFLKPKLQSEKVTNLLFTGQLTVPGPGVPPAIISGQVAAREAIKWLSERKSR